MTKQEEKDKQSNKITQFLYTFTSIYEIDKYRSCLPFYIFIVASDIFKRLYVKICLYISDTSVARALKGKEINNQLIRTHCCSV